jgi:malonate-semialdehyde dehydrogenase (acetylating) / methylmalonate-semialdehyde dehydrogenase
MKVYSDEIFGPVLTMVRVDSLDHALDLIRENQYGNGASIFTKSGNDALRFESEAEVGMVGINVSVPVPVSYYSFGGWNNSMFGDLNVYGPDGIRFYTRGKVVTSRWNSVGKSHQSLSYPSSADADVAES